VHPVRTIQTTVRVEPGGTIAVSAPADLPAGDYRVVITLEAEGAGAGRPLPPFPVDDYGPWPSDLTLRREDMYDDGGR
jgi:hypothetical protein